MKTTAKMFCKKFNSQNFYSKKQTNIFCRATLKATQSTLIKQQKITAYSAFPLLSFPFKQPALDSPH
jgi:hypothetical protein